MTESRVGRAEVLCCAMTTPPTTPEPRPPHPCPLRPVSEDRSRRRIRTSVRPVLAWDRLDLLRGELDERLGDQPLVEAVGFVDRQLQVHGAADRVGATGFGTDV